MNHSISESNGGKQNVSNRYFAVKKKQFFVHLNK